MAKKNTNQSKDFYTTMSEMERKYFDSLKEIEKDFYLQSKILYQDHNISSLKQKKADLKDKNVEYEKSIGFDTDGVLALSNESMNILHKHNARISKLNQKIKTADVDFNAQSIELAKNTLGDDSTKAQSITYMAQKLNPPVRQYDDLQYNLTEAANKEKNKLTKFVREIEKTMGSRLDDIDDKYINAVLKTEMLQKSKYNNPNVDIEESQYNLANSLNSVKESQKGLKDVDVKKLPIAQQYQIQLEEEALERKKIAMDEANNELRSKKQSKQSINKLGELIPASDFSEVNNNFFKARDEYLNGLAELNNKIKDIAKGKSVDSPLSKNQNNVIDITTQKPAMSQVASGDPATYGKSIDQVKAEAEEEDAIIRRNVGLKKSAELEINEAEKTAEKIVEIEKETTEKIANIESISIEAIEADKLEAKKEYIEKASSLKKSDIKSMNDEELAEFIKLNSSIAQIARDEKTYRGKDAMEKARQDRELKQEEKFQQRKNESAKEYEERQVRNKLERQAEQQIRELKQEKQYLERKEEQEKRYEKNQAEREALAAKRHSEQLEKMAQMDNSRMTQAAKGALVAGAGMLGIYGVGDSIERSMRTGVEFGSNLNLVQAISGSSDEQLVKLEKSAMDVGKTTKATAGEVALLQVELVKLGKTPDEVIGATNSLVKFSGIFQTELAQTASVAAKQAQVFGIEIPRMLDIMGATFRNTPIKDLAQFEQSLSEGSAAAKALGYSTEEAIALMATAVKNGQVADQASRGIGRLITEARNAKGEVAKFLGGVANNYDELISKINAMSAAQKEESIIRMKANNLTDVNMKNSLMILMNAGSEVDNLKTKLVDSNGLIENSYTKAMQSLKNQWELVTSAIETMVLTNYKELEPSFFALTKSAQKFLEAMGDPDSSVSKLTEGVKALTLAVASFTIVGGGVVGIGTALKAVYALVAANPLTAAIAGISALGVAIYSLVDSEKEALEIETQRIELSKKTNEQFLERHKNEIKELETTKELTSEFEELAKKEKLSDDEKARMSTILADLKKIYPDVVTSTTNHANALEQVRSAAEMANLELEKLTETQKNIAKRDVINKILLNKDELVESGEDLSDNTGSKFSFNPFNRTSNISLNPLGKSDIEKSKDNFFTAQIQDLQGLLRENKFDEIKKAIAVLNDDLYKFKGMVETGDNPAYMDKDFIKRAENLVDNANSLATKIETRQSLEKTKIDLFGTSKTNESTKPIPCRKCGTVHTTGECPLDNQQPTDNLQDRSDLKLEKLKLKSEFSKKLAEFDKSDITLQREALNDDYNYKQELAKKELKLDDGKNLEKTKILKIEKELREQLNELEKDTASMKIDAEFELRDMVNDRQNIELALKDQPNDLQKKIEFEKALTLEKQTQLNNQFNLGALSEKELEIQLELLAKTEKNNLAKINQSDAANQFEKDQIKSEIEKTKSLDFDFASEEKQITLKYKIEVAKLDPLSADYAEKLRLLKSKEEQEKDKLIERKITIKTTIELLTLQNRRSEFFKDYALDSQILDKTYEQKSFEINQNTNLTGEEKTANIDKLSKEKTSEQKKLLNDYVDYYSTITQKSFGMIKQLSDFHYNQELNKAKKLYDEKSKLADKEYQAKVRANQGANRTLAVLEAEHEKNKEKLEAEREKRLLEIQKKKQGWALAEASINIAVAITKALAESSLMGWVNAAAATITGGIQLAQIEAQQFNTGKVLINQPDNKNDRILGWFADDETIINSESSRANAPLLNSINEAKGLYEPKIPTIQPFMVNNVDSLLYELRMIRHETVNNAEKISGSVDAKNWSVKIHNENKGFDPRTVSQTVKTGNDKNAKLTILNS